MGCVLFNKMLFSQLEVQLGCGGLPKIHLFDLKESTKQASTMYYLQNVHHRETAKPMSEPIILY